MPDEDQKPANTETGSSDVKQPVTSDIIEDQEKVPEGHKKILIGKTFVIGGVAIRIDKIPKKAKGGQGIVIHGLNLKVYDELALFVMGSWYKPINLHLARRDGQAIEFTLPNFNKILQEGNDIWVRLSSSRFAQASGTLNKYIAYTFKDEEEEEKEEKAKAEEEKKKKFDEAGKGKAGGLAALAEESVANVLGNLAEPFLPAFLKKDNALSDAKSALQSGNKQALKDAVKKSKDLKDLDGLKKLLKDAGDDENRRLISDSITELEKNGLAPEKLGGSEAVNLNGSDEEGEIDYLDDDSPEIEQAEAVENNARLDLHQKQEEDREFAEQFGAEAQKEEKKETSDVTEDEFFTPVKLVSFSPEQQVSAKELAKSLSTEVFKKVIQKYGENAGAFESPDKDPMLGNIFSEVTDQVKNEYFDKVVYSPLLEQEIKLFLLDNVSRLVTKKVLESFPQKAEAYKGRILDYFLKTGIASPSGSVNGGIQVQSDGSTQTALQGQVGIFEQEKIKGLVQAEAQVQGGEQGEVRAEISTSALSGSREANVQEKTKSEVNTQGESGLNRKVEAELQEERSGAAAGTGSQVSKKLDLRVKSGGASSSPGKSDINVQGESGLNKQVEGELKEAASGAAAGTGSQVLSQLNITGAQPGVREQDGTQVNIKGESGLNLEEELKLKVERQRSAAGAGSQVSTKSDLNVQQSVSADENLSTNEVDRRVKASSVTSEREKSSESDSSDQDRGRTSKLTEGSKKPTDQTGNEGAIKQNEDMEAVRVKSEVSSNVGQKPYLEQTKPVSVAPLSQEEGVPSGILPQKTPTKEPAEPKRPLDLPKAERKYPRRPFKDTRSLNDLMSAGIRGKEDLSKHPSVWQTVKRIAEKKLAGKPGTDGSLGDKGVLKKPLDSTLNRRGGQPEDEGIQPEKLTPGIGKGREEDGVPEDRAGTRGEPQVQPGQENKQIEEGSPPDGSSALPLSQEPGSQGVQPKQGKPEESPVSRIASKIASEPGVGQAAGQVASKVWWYGFDAAAAVFFSGLDFMLGAVVMDAYWIFGHRKDKNIFPLKTWQKAVTVFANIAPLIYLVIIFIILLVVGCETPIVNKMIGDDVCKNVQITTNNLSGSSTQTASQGGPVATIRWTEQINRVAGDYSLNPCVLRAVVQKKIDENLDLEDIAKGLKYTISKNGNDLVKAFIDTSGLGVEKKEAEDLLTLYNLCINNQGEQKDF